ncbi:hypothetical protein Taro_021963 [Colocasia esculenta]|uniref:Uncharacterized protein n=1 Tax=Colocasia esculenta TaxID=4460 RepID=A0A843V082_COLES|nr:hypothetical protein [Colocasia esculenta]
MPLPPRKGETEPPQKHTNAHNTTAWPSCGLTPDLHTRLQNQHRVRQTPAVLGVPGLTKRALQTTQRRCPNLVFPSALEFAQSAANSSTLVASNAPSKAPEDGGPRQ